MTSTAALVMVLLLSACGPTALPGDGRQQQPSDDPGIVAASRTAAPSPLTGSARNVPTPPDGRAYFGVQLSWGDDTPTRYAARLGRSPAVYGGVTQYPLTAADKAAMSLKVDQVAQQRAMLFVTLEPTQSLATVTTANAADLAATVAGWNARGVPVFVGFGQEMNGSWYPWGQQPAAYIAAFRTIADAVHRVALKSVMVWSPAYGGGYPFPAETYNAKPGTADFRALDTNRDGRLTPGDDPYLPYYPGDAWVDWVGVTLSHWGCTYPWGANVLPEPDKFLQQVTGVYHGACDDQRLVGNFYAIFAAGHQKPMALTATSAYFSEANATKGASNAAIKSAWMAQVFDPSLAQTLPLLKLVSWLEYRHAELGSTDVIDWRATADPATLAALSGALGPRFVLAPVAS